MPTKYNIDKIIATLAAEDIHISQEELNDLLEKSNVTKSGMLTKLAQKVGESQQTEKPKKDQINKQSAKTEAAQLFVNRKGPSSLSKYNRYTQESADVPDKLLDQVVQRYTGLKQLSDEIGEMEIRDATVGDQAYIVTNEEKVDSHLESIQQSIGSYNEYKKKYNVVKRFQSGGQPSLDLQSELI